MTNQKISPMMIVGVTEKTALAQKSVITGSVYFALLDEREEDGFADAETGECHEQSVDSHPLTAARGHAVFERGEKIVVELLLLAAGLMLQRGALLNGIVLLGVAGGNLLAVDAALEDLDGRRIVGRKLGERLRGR